MNNFTKEELESLYDCCEPGIYEDHPPLFWKVMLQEKIQYMIDNYCEHEEYKNLANVILCRKCDAVGVFKCNHEWMSMEHAYLQCKHCFRRKGMYE